MNRAPIDKQDIQRIREAMKARQTRMDGRGEVAGVPADEKNRERRTRPGKPVDFPGMKRADKANTGKGPRPFPMPDKGAALAAILDRAADRIGRDEPELIVVDLITEIRRAGMYDGKNKKGEV